MIDSDTEVGTRREARRWSVVAAASAALLALGLILVVGRPALAVLTCCGQQAVAQRVSLWSDWSAARPASSRATGTRNGEHDT